jgi:hypothetical protein
MNIRILLAASLLLSTLSFVPAASACRSDLPYLHEYCAGEPLPLPCLSVNCVKAIALGVAGVVLNCAEKIAEYDWANWDPAHDPLPSFECINLNN